jgi:hypothetical protein
LSLYFVLDDEMTWLMMDDRDDDAGMAIDQHDCDQVKDWQSRRSE